MKCKYLEHQVMIRPDGEFRMCCISKEKTNKKREQNLVVIALSYTPVAK